MISIVSNERRQQLLKILETTYEGVPITMEKIAELLHSSVRTVRYDLDLLEEEIREEGLLLKRKARKGIWLENMEEKPNALRNPEVSYVFSPKERCEQIIVELLDRQRCFVDELADRLMVSRNTLLADLKGVQEILGKRNLQYESKRGLGIWAQGDEQDIRDMLIHVFAKSVYDFRQYDGKHKQFIGMQQMFCRYAAKIPVQKIAEFFLECLRENGVIENDVPANRMICALVVQTKRLQQGYAIEQENQIDFLSDEGAELERISQEIARGMERFATGFSALTEVQCIMKELLHSRINFWNSLQQSPIQEMNVKALAMAREFIEYVQVWLGDIYLDDEELIYNLAMHLQPAIERARYHILLTNPLLVQIRTQYNSLFIVARRAAEQLGNRMGIRLSEDEIGYLTIHLGAAVERRKLRKTKRLSVLLVCGNGVGTANLLAMTLRNRMPYIDIQKVLSLYKMEEQNLADIDIIISTVSLEIPGKAVLRVSPILTEAEIKIIEGQIRYFYDRKIIPDRTATLLEDKPGLALLLDESMMLLDECAEDWEEAVRKAGQLLLSAGAVRAEYVDSMIRCVKEIGPYIVVCPGVAMPHSRVEDGALRVAVSFLRLKEPIRFTSGKNSVPVDMIFAFATTDEGAHIRMMMDLWNIFTDKAALKKLRSCKTKQDVLRFVQQYSQQG